MKRLIAGLCLITIVATYGAQQDKNKREARARPDLSGTWVLVQSKSNLGKIQKDITNYTLTIADHEPEIRITKRFSKAGREYREEWIYYTDGRHENSPGSENVEVQTKWRDNKLYRRITIKRSNPFSSIPQETVRQEEWEISKDSSVLIRTVRESSLISPHGRSGRNEPSNERYVFTRRS